MQYVLIYAAGGLLYGLIEILWRGWTHWSMVLCGGLCFLMMYLPSKVIRPEVNSYNDLTTFILYIVYKADTPTNCFPSGHCLLCFTLLYSLLDNKQLSKKLKIPAIIINILIIASTLLVKQHVILDVVASFLLATISYHFIINLKIFDKIKKKLKSHA